MDNEQVPRLGLALSGGGFRASFYHIGVLARMAELGLLRHVESISTVSGGSIVGAAYYLLVKSLLEGKADADIVDDDYVKLVEKLEQHFLAAVQKNLRMRTFANPWKNICMVLPNYSRSDTIGELYEHYIYKPLIDVGERRIRMSDLLINPMGIDSAFHPLHESVGNATRAHKVPVLNLNATSLNSGHNWIFTAKSMGEVPPRNANFRDIDKKDRYRRVRYDDITTRDKFFALGSAVAASAGVPGLFPPMAVSKLYKGHRVQLVDGGVYDNQGISGLLDPDYPCSDFVISDASGQSDATDSPQTDLLSVLGSSSSILADRVREEMVNNLEQVYLGRSAYFHLKRGLFARDIEYNEGGINPHPGPKMMAGLLASETDFAVTQDAQNALAHIRTDLDSFTDVEAGCLAADAYQMSESRLVALKPFLAPQRSTGLWHFEPYRAVLKIGEAQALQQLDLARQRFLKPYLYMFNGATTFAKSLGLILVSLPVAATLVTILALIDWGVRSTFGFGLWQIISNRWVFQEFLAAIAPAIYVLLVSLLLSKLAEKLIRVREGWTSILLKILKGPMAVISGLALKILAPAILAIPIFTYLYTVDSYYLRYMGKLDSNAP